MNNFLSKVLGLIAFTLLVSPCLISQNNVKLEPISCEVSDKVKNSVRNAEYYPGTLDNLFCPIIDIISDDIIYSITIDTFYVEYCTYGDISRERYFVNKIIEKYGKACNFEYGNPETLCGDFWGSDLSLKSKFCEEVLSDMGVPIWCNDIWICKDGYIIFYDILSLDYFDKETITEDDYSGRIAITYINFDLWKRKYYESK